MARRFWTLKVSTWENGTHWYGSLWEGGDFEATIGIRVDYVLSESHATEFNAIEDWNTYRAGDRSERFLTRDELLAAAIQEFNVHARRDDILVLREVIAIKGPE